MVKELHADQNYPAAHDEEQSKGFLNTAYIIRPHCQAFVTCMYHYIRHIQQSIFQSPWPYWGWPVFVRHSFHSSPPIARVPVTHSRCRSPAIWSWRESSLIHSPGPGVVPSGKGRRTGHPHVPMVAHAGHTHAGVTYRIVVSRQTISAIHPKLAKTRRDR